MKTPAKVGAATKKPPTRKAAKQDRFSTDLNRLPGDKWVSMSNALVTAAHGLTLAEKRVIAMAISCIDSNKVTTDKVSFVELNAQDFAQTFDIDPDTAYDQLQTAGRDLFKRSVTFQYLDKRHGAIKVNMRWVGAVTYHKGQGRVTLGLWPELLPHLTKLKKNFTTYQLHQAAALRSVYSWRLLELLLQFESTGWREMSVEDFALAMGATDKQRGDFNNLKRRMIEPACKELAAKDGWLITWAPICAGRKVKALRFDFSRNPQGGLLY